MAEFGEKRETVTDRLGRELADLRRSMAALNVLVAGIRSVIEVDLGRPIPDQLLERNDQDWVTNS